MRLPEGVTIEALEEPKGASSGVTVVTSQTSVASTGFMSEVFVWKEGRTLKLFLP